MHCFWHWVQNINCLWNLLLGFASNVPYSWSISIKIYADCKTFHSVTFGYFENIRKLTRKWKLASDDMNVLTQCPNVASDNHCWPNCFWWRRRKLLSRDFACVIITAVANLILKASLGALRNIANVAYRQKSRQILPFSDTSPNVCPSHFQMFTPLGCKWGPNKVLNLPFT